MIILISKFINKKLTFYSCPRNEICCTFGCCISSNFHFYQLWYYWLMVILMFLLCSGGTWWYRYWLQEGHYPPAPPPTHRPPPPRHQIRCTTRGATYHPGRTTRVVVQHTWKPNSKLVNIISWRFCLKLSLKVTTVLQYF